MTIGKKLDEFINLEIRYIKANDSQERINITSQIRLVKQEMENIKKRIPSYYTYLFNIKLRIYQFLQDCQYKDLYAFDEARKRVVKLLDGKIGTETYYTSSRDPRYIRYLSLCYDKVYCNIDVDDIINTFTTKEIIKTNEDIYPLPEFFDDFDKPHTIKYLVGGRINDVVQCMYVIKMMYAEINHKAVLYITDNRKWGGDSFSLSLQETYNQSRNMIMQQEYIHDYRMYNDEQFDINLNDFRKNPKIMVNSWYEIMSSSFGVPIIVDNWMTCDKKVDNLSNTVLIYWQADVHHNEPQISDVISAILWKNDCKYLMLNKHDYNKFPFKQFIQPIEASTYDEAFVLINSCKFFIGDDTFPHAFAYSLNHPCLCDCSSCVFYERIKYHDNNNWIGRNSSEINQLGEFVDLRFDPVLNRTFYEQNNVDSLVKDYFPRGYNGKCIEFGEECITKHFRLIGWDCMLAKHHSEIPQDLRKVDFICINQASDRFDITLQPKVIVCKNLSADYLEEMGYKLDKIRSNMYIYVKN